ncbi:MAG: sigma 54-interacting transcriptional regulator [Archangiaceae bacterium]|nr:sigma 54-interacting transcriptional regulator [Archangiaceae bacterium]
MMTVTRTLLRRGELELVRIPRVRVRLSAPGGAVRERVLGLEECVVGSDSTCALVTTDPSVSRRHLALSFGDHGITLRDLGSKNGTRVAGLRVSEVTLPLDVEVELGDSRLRLVRDGDDEERPLSREPRFGDAVGVSPVMRALFQVLDKAAAADAPVLLLGESGTGKEVLARAVHERSPRRQGPFVVVDCGAIAPTLVEAELFGRERGAFTGADTAQAGLFEQAHGGTVFLDELGELPLELQTRLLRVLERREVRRVGGTEARPADARVIAATHRDLEDAVDRGRFRSDLFYRLAVVVARVPALRERREDLALLVETLLARQRPPRRVAELPPGALELLRAYDWPGNVRELHNVLIRLLVLPATGAEVFGPQAGLHRERAGAAFEAYLGLPLKDARERLVGDFEGRYLEQMLAAHDGKVAAAAKAMGVSRQFVYLMMGRYGMRARDDE